MNLKMSSQISGNCIAISKEESKEEYEMEVEECKVFEQAVFMAKQQEYSHRIINILKCFWQCLYNKKAVRITPMLIKVLFGESISEDDVIFLVQRHLEINVDYIEKQSTISMSGEALKSLIILVDTSAGKKFRLSYIKAEKIIQNVINDKLHLETTRANQLKTKNIELQQQIKQLNQEIQGLKDDRMIAF